MKRSFLITILFASAIVTATAQRPTVSEFFDRFTAEWIRQSPNQAIGARYFSGAEQQALDRQLTPQTDEWNRSRRELAKRGLAELATFDPARMNKADRLSAELMRWQLEIVVEAGAYDDYSFPFNQFDGVNVNLVNALTVVQPLLSEQDAENTRA